MNNQNLLIKASVAAKQLGKSSTTIRRMVQDGRILGEKNGGMVVGHTPQLALSDIGGKNEVVEGLV